MGTPASIASELPQHQTPKSCTRKRASANIFHGVGLWQLRRLFHSTGDAQAEERAQLVWECAENRCITQALQQLHRRQRKMRFRSTLRPPRDKSSSTRLLELQHFSRLWYGMIRFVIPEFQSPSLGINSVFSSKPCIRYCQGSWDHTHAYNTK